MTTSHQRGHVIVFIKGVWKYEDTGESILGERPCVKCGELPTPNGHDFCLGEQPGVVSACCGHGVHKPITMKCDNGRYRGLAGMFFG